MTQPEQPAVTVGPSFDQIVVDVGDLEGVKQVLSKLDIGHAEFDRIETLGLVLLGVAALDVQQVKALDGGTEALEEIEKYNAENRVKADVTAFDVLTRLLRNRFQTEIGRDLDIGKNRDVDQLEALPHWGGGEGLPTAATAEQFRLHGGPAGLGPKTGDGMTFGVIDSELYRSHGLDGRVTEADGVTDRPPRRAWQGHAAFVAGRILLRAPNANIIVRSVLDKNGMAKAWDVAYQMVALVELGATVLTMALASYPADGEEPFLIRRAVAWVKDKALIVAAAGNHGNADAVAVTEGRGGQTGRVLTADRTAKAYPAASDGVVAVGAASVERVETVQTVQTVRTVRTVRTVQTVQTIETVETVETVGGKFTLTPADLTPEVDWVNVWAPGVDQVSTFLEGNVEARMAAVDGNTIRVTAQNLGSFTGYACWSGTSGATGDVSGEIARLAATNDLKGARGALEEILGRHRVGEVDGTDIRPANWPGDWPRPVALKA